MNVTLGNGRINEEINDATRISDMRDERNSLLAQSDWTQMPDSPLTDSKKQEWATYRQALRDFPDGWTPADTANLPNQPS
jgi:hypothetical protein